MARERGTFNFSASLEIKKEGALDARQVVQTKAELIQASTWLDDDDKIWLYNGLLVCVVADTDINNGVYFLKDKDNYTDSSNWIKISSISGSTPDELLEAINNALEEAKAYTDDKTGTVTFTGSNYITGSSDLTEAVVELDDQLKNVRDTYLPLSGGKMTGIIRIPYNGLQTNTNNSLIFFNETELWYGSVPYKAVFDTSNTDMIHRKNGVNHIIYDESNFVAGTDYLAPGAVTIADISDLGSTWDSYLKAGVYNRNITVNGTSYPVMTNVSGATAINIYAPTTAGTTGQFLKSTGGTPSWNSITVADISNLNSTWDGFMTGSNLATRNILINGSAWTVYSSVGTDTTRIYAPTTMSTNPNHVLTGSSDNIPKWGYPNVVSVHDIRDLDNQNPTPDDVTGGIARFYFTNQSLPSATGMGQWVSKLTVAGWNAGYNVWELAGGSTTTLCENLAFRAGINDTWGDWHTIAFQDWTNTQLAKYLPLTAGSSKPLTGTLHINGYSQVGINQYPLGLIVGDGTYTRGIEIRSHRCTLGLGSHKDGVIRFWRNSDDDSTFTGYFAEIDAANGGFHHNTNMFMSSNKHIALSESSYLRIPASSTGACGITNSGVSEGLNNVSLYFPGDTSMVVGNSNYTTLALRTNASSNLVHRKGTSDYKIYDESNLFARTITFNNIDYDVKTTIATSQQQAFKFYAPTSAGTQYQVLRSNGSGAPVWSNIYDVISSVYIPLATYKYDSTNNTRSIWNKIGTLLAGKMGTKQVQIRLRAFEDNNYPSYSEWILAWTVYNPNGTTTPSSRNIYMSPTQYNTNHLYLGVDEDFNIWVRSDVEWDCVFQFILEYATGGSTGVILFTSNIETIDPATQAVPTFIYEATDICKARGTGDNALTDYMNNGYQYLPKTRIQGSLQVTENAGFSGDYIRISDSTEIRISNSTDANSGITSDATGGTYFWFPANYQLVVGNSNATDVTLRTISANSLYHQVGTGTKYKIFDAGNLGTITFTGAVSATYNGQSNITVNIPQGGGGGVADSVDWSNITNKPTWIGSTKPTYTWSEISGKPSSFTPSAHTYSASDITSGTLALARIPTGTTSSTVALGNHTHSQYLTSSSLSGYATQSWVNGQIDAITPASIGAAASSHGHVFSDITFNNTGTNAQYLAGDGKFYTVGWNEIGSKPSSFTPSSHTHSASDITSGTLALARIPTGTTSSTVALGNHTHSNYLTSSSLSGYATQTWVNQQIAAIDIPDTSGFVTLTGTQTISGAKTFTNSNGVRSSYGFYDTSDIRLKSNIQDIELKDKINLYEFDKQGKHSYGVIAQEVEQLYPSVVNTDENGYKTVNYNEVLSIKCAELEAENKELKARLDKLEALVNSLL